MKRIGLVVLALVTATSLIGCGSSVGSPTPGAAAPSVPPAAAAPAGTEPPATKGVLAEVKSSGEVPVGWAEWNPLEYRDATTNTLKGMLIDMATDIAQHLGVKPKFVEDSWATLASGVAAGKFHVALEGITAERAKVVDFSHPLYETVFTAIVKKDSPYKTWDDLNKAGVSISVTTGSNTDQLLTQLAGEGKLKATIVRIKDVGPGVLAMVSGQVQAYTDQKDALLAVVEKHPEDRLVDGSYGAAQFALAVPKGDAAFKAAVDEAVAAMLKDGTVQKLLDQYHIQGNEPAPIQ